MKSSCEIAMERFNQTAPTVKTTIKQKKELAELDSRYAAKIAEREIALRREMMNVRDAEKEEILRGQLVQERKKLQAGLEEKKERVRNGTACLNPPNLLPQRLQIFILQSHLPNNFFVGQINRLSQPLLSLFQMPELTRIAG